MGNASYISMQVFLFVKIVKFDLWNQIPLNSMIVLGTGYFILCLSFVPDLSCHCGIIRDARLVMWCAGPCIVASADTSAFAHPHSCVDDHKIVSFYPLRDSSNAEEVSMSVPEGHGQTSSFFVVCSLVDHVWTRFILLMSPKQAYHE